MMRHTSSATALLVSVAIAATLTGCTSLSASLTGSTTSPPISDACAPALAAKASVTEAATTFNNALASGDTATAATAVSEASLAGATLTGLVADPTASYAATTIWISAEAVTAWVDLAQRHLDDDPRVTIETLLAEHSTLRERLSGIDDACNT